MVRPPGVVVHCATQGFLGHQRVLNQADTPPVAGAKDEARREAVLIRYVGVDVDLPSFTYITQYPGSKNVNNVNNVNTHTYIHTYIQL